MVVAWIVITLMIALVVGFIWGVTADDGIEGIFAGWWIVCMSFFIACVYVAGHFISKYW